MKKSLLFMAASATLLLAACTAESIKKLFLYIFGWLHIFFEVKKTPEEKLKEREEFIEAYVAYLEKTKR